MTLAVFAVLAVCVIMGIAIVRRALSDNSAGASVACPRCRSENRPGASFCAQCGQKLTE